MSENSISNFLSNATLKWLCLKGDYVFWFTWTNIFADPQHEIKIKDLWEMKEDDFLTITNRIEDMPKWFSFHPTEVCNSLAYRLLEKFNNGDYPEEPFDAHNIWRPKIGDRLVWLRKSPLSSPKDLIVSAIAFRESALVIGENVQTKSIDQLFGFGVLTKDQQTSEDIAMARNAIDLVKQMGVPREYASNWQLG
jgi:hypothetical protein